MHYKTTRFAFPAACSIKAGFEFVADSRCATKQDIRSLNHFDLIKTKNKKPKHSFIRKFTFVNLNFLKFYSNCYKRFSSYKRFLQVEPFSVRVSSAMEILKKRITVVEKNWTIESLNKAQLPTIAVQVSARFVLIFISADTQHCS